jgi:heme A synthase
MARLARYCWFVLLYNFAVIAWGAYVRATGSGAGCGAHWPLCNGEMMVRPESVKQAIEFSHRVTSGLALVTVVVMVVWAWRITKPGHPARLGAGLSLGFMLSEAALGAGLVLFGLVDTDSSPARAFAVSAHLLNTFLLLASLTLAVYWTSGGPRLRVDLSGRSARSLALGAMILLIVSVAGAITALGDTLFPSGTLVEGLQADLSSTAHFLIRLRVIHPVLAVMGAIYTVVTVWPLARGSAALHSLAWTLTVLVAAQLIAGAVNVVLLAPVWLQLVHLLLADAVWVTYLFFGAGVLAGARESVVVTGAALKRGATYEAG